MAQQQPMQGQNSGKPLAIQAVQVHEMTTHAPLYFVLAKKEKIHTFGKYNAKIFNHEHT